MEEDKTLCCNCNNEVEDDLIEHDSEKYCQECFDELFFTCDDCGEILAQEDYCQDGLCQDCWNENNFICYDCGDAFNNDDRHSYDDRSYCGDCFNDSFGYCDDCGEAERQDYLRYNDNGCYCESCSHDDSIIHNHDYTPDSDFHGEGPLYFGFELEIQNQNNSDQESHADNIMNNSCLPLYCKEDGSVSNGFEVVSHPLDWTYYKKHESDFADMLKDCVKKGYKSHDTDCCGLHISLSFKAFSTIHLSKFLKFVYSNPGFILKLSQRTLANLSRWAACDESESQPANCLKRAKKDFSAGKYQAVNITGSRVEIRIFRGTLKPERFFKNFEFCKALFEYTNKTFFKQVTLDGFFDFLHENKTEYPNLFSFLIDKNIMNERTLKLCA